MVTHGFGSTLVRGLLFPNVDNSYSLTLHVHGYKVMLAAWLLIPSASQFQQTHSTGYLYSSIAVPLKHHLSQATLTTTTKMICKSISFF